VASTTARTVHDLNLIYVSPFDVWAPAERPEPSVTDRILVRPELTPQDTPEGSPWTRGSRGVYMRGTGKAYDPAARVTPQPWIETMIGMIRIATMFAILIIGLIAGPAVSLYGSPTVSPVTAAACASEPFPP
jgi:hypothetical protein